MSEGRASVSKGRASVSEGRAVAAADGQGPPQMVTTFLGLTGPNGVLPSHYTTLLIERIRARISLRDFLDLFNHRTASLFYRAWQKYRFPFTYEQSCWSTAGEPDDLLTQCLYCLLGLGTGGLRGRLASTTRRFCTTAATLPIIRGRPLRWSGCWPTISNCPSPSGSSTASGSI